jgi:hypothetical protein
VRIPDLLSPGDGWPLVAYADLIDAPTGSPIRRSNGPGKKTNHLHVQTRHLYLHRDPRTNHMTAKPDPNDVIMVTRKEAARRMSLSVSEIDEARRRGDLASQHYGAKIRIPLDDLRRFAESLPADEM